MKLETENSTILEGSQIHLPFGLIGLSDLQRFELMQIENSWPFISMRSVGGDEINFVVFEPQGLIPGYEIELSDEDADCLQIQSADDALVLNIVTILSMRPQYVTVNLIGPIVVNRNTFIAKQVIIANAEKFSTRHPLIDERSNASPC